jgi:hypothetical protein
MFGNGAGKGFGFGLGLNLIGLLVVIAILGVSAALAFSAFGGGTTGLTSGTLPGLTATTVPGSTTGATTPNAGTTTPTTARVTPATSTPGTVAVSRAAAVAACESDATDVETAVQAYAAVHGSATGVTPAQLSPYLQAFPSSQDYSISVVSGQVMVAAPKTATPVAYDSPGACAQAGM